jgi:hypothetical protein
MPTRRTPLKRAALRQRITPELRAKAERLMELNEAHMAAIREEPGAEAFYTDGRHQELVDLLPEVHRALGIKPWEDDDAKLAEALQ